MLHACAIVAAVGTMCCSAPAPPAPDQRAPDKVGIAIDKGVDYLKKLQQKVDDNQSNWEHSELMNRIWPGGATCLVTLALLTSGVPADDEVIQRALPFIRGLNPKLTYVIALQTMALAEVGAAKDRDLIQKNVNLLLEGRMYKGQKLVGWSYSKAGHIQSDNSNTQFALLGLLAGRHAGVKIAEADWREIQEFYIDSQVILKPDPPQGGWPYHDPQGGIPLSPTMTVAGLAGLWITGHELAVGRQKPNEKTGVAEKCGQYEEDEALARGMRWLGKNFVFDLSDHVHKATFYNVYGIERLGRLSGQRFIGGHDWYREGCELLCGLKKETALAQAADGSWQTGQGYDNMPVLSTSFALLFLARGRTPVLISKLAFDTPGANKGANWNRKHHDARHLVEFASKALFKKQPLAWQVFDPRSADLNDNDFEDHLTILLQAPILYFSGHEGPILTPRQIELLRRYVNQGGFIFAEACCGDRAFRERFAKLMVKVFQDDAPLTPLPANHPIWAAPMRLDPKEVVSSDKEEDRVQCVKHGSRTAVVFSPQPLAGFWEESRFMPQNDLAPRTRGELAYRFAGNVIAHATGLKMPKPQSERFRPTEPALPSPRSMSNEQP
jgi:hypothetical protein